MVPFVYRQIWSAEGKVGLRSSSLTSTRWIWVETSLGPATLHLFAQEPARKRNSQSPFWALCLGFTCDLSWAAGNYRHPEPKENWKREGLPLQQDHRFCISHCDRHLQFMSPAQLHRREIFYLLLRHPCAEKTRKGWVIVVVVSTWGLQEVSPRTLYRGAVIRLWGWNLQHKIHKSGGTRSRLMELK